MGDVLNQQLKEFICCPFLVDHYHELQIISNGLVQYCERYLSS